MSKSLAKILMCAPKHFTVSYEINPWMNKRIAVDHRLATAQWDKLKSTLIGCGAEIHLVEQQPGLPDMVFTANAAMMMGKKVYLSQFKFPERQGERRHFESWFKQAGYEVYGDTEDNFEGAGDILQAGEKLFAAFGFRTDERVYQRIRDLWQLKNPLITCKLVDPRFYHIDTCFCPITDKLAIWFPKAFDSKSQAQMENNIELLAVPEKEAERFACNSVVIGKQVVTPGDCPETGKILEKRGYQVHNCEMTEFLKAGGACKCLTLAI